MAWWDVTTICSIVAVVCGIVGFVLGDATATAECERRWREAVEHERANRIAAERGER